MGEVETEVPDAPEPDAPDAPPAPDEGDVEAPEQVEDAWSGVAQNEWEATQRYLQAAAPLLEQLDALVRSGQLQLPGQQPQQPQPQQPAEPDFDPFDPNSVNEYMSYKIQQGIQQALQPFDGLLTRTAQAEGEQLARSELNTIRESVGDFDEDTALLIGSGLIEQGHDPSQALRTAATFSHEYEERIRANEREKVIEEMRSIAEAPPAQPGVNGSTGQEGIEEEMPTGRDKYKVVVERALARQRGVIRPTG